MRKSTSTFRELPVIVSGRDGFKWFLSEPKIEKWAQLVEQHLAGKADSRLIELIRKATNRLIFRLKPDWNGSAGQTMVAKSFPMTKLKQRLYQYVRYGPAEVCNLLEAARRSLPVPKVYGFALQRKWSMVRQAVVIMEDISPFRPVGDLLKEAPDSPGLRQRILEVVGDLLLKLYKTGCNHIDVNENAVFIDEALAGPAKIIDFQYARYLDSPTPIQLIFQTAYFSWSCIELISEKELDTWSEQLFEKAGLDEPARWAEIYRGYRHNRFPRSVRMALK